MSAPAYRLHTLSPCMRVIAASRLLGRVALYLARNWTVNPVAMHIAKTKGVKPYDCVELG